MYDRRIPVTYMAANGEIEEATYRLLAYVRFIPWAAHYNVVARMNDTEWFQHDATAEDSAHHTVSLEWVKKPCGGAPAPRRWYEGTTTAGSSFLPCRSF